MRLRLFTFLVVIFFATACGSDSANTAADNKFGKLKIEVPASLKDNPAACEYIKEMNVIVDEFAVLFDEVIEDCAEYKGMKEEDLSFADKITLTKATAKFAMGSVEILGKWGNCETKRLEIDKDLTSEQRKDLDKVYNRVEKRMEQIQEKHKEFFADDKKDTEKKE